MTAALAIAAILAIAALPAIRWLGRRDAALDAADRDQRRQQLAADPPRDYDSETWQEARAILEGCGYRGWR